jgi:uncharacterized protein (DUF427 family)
MKTAPVEIPMTARLRRAAERWRGSTKPPFVTPAGPGQRSVWDFPRPPAVERVLERVTVELAGQTIVDTQQCLRVCETASPPTYYMPRADVAMQFVRPGSGTSGCEWKGFARYFDLVVGDRVSAQAAWWYPNVEKEYAVLADHIAFYASRADRCTVAGEVVAPQPGGFYAGWITKELTGPWKGGPGTQGW